MLCIIIAWILSSSDPFIRVMSWLMFSGAVPLTAATRSVWLFWISHFLCWLLRGIRATISDVFLGIKHCSSRYSSLVWAFEIWEKREWRREKKKKVFWVSPINRNHLSLFPSVSGAKSTSLSQIQRCVSHRSQRGCN